MALIEALMPPVPQPRRETSWSDSWSHLDMMRKVREVEDAAYERERALKRSIFQAFITGMAQGLAQGASKRLQQ